jgi:hypothetical protein
MTVPSFAASWTSIIMLLFADACFRLRKSFADRPPAGPSAGRFVEVFRRKEAAAGFGFRLGGANIDPPTCVA